MRPQPRRFALARCLAAGLLLASLGGCDDGLDRPSELKTLRVLAVRADQPYAAPGASVHLDMLAVDAAPGAVKNGARRPVRVAWIGACANPEGDLQGACYPALHRAAAQLTDDDLAAEKAPAAAPPGLFGFGPSFDLRLPDDLIATHPRVDSARLPYGLAYAFFLACGGAIRLDRSAAPGDFPLGCFDPETGARLGVDDAVVGYFPVWAYEQLRNQNPAFSEPLLLAGPSEPRPCAADADCPDGHGCGSAGQCLRVVARCQADDPDDCPAISLQPRVDPASPERAETATLSPSEAPLENLWVSYFSQQGRIDDAVRFVHDGDIGWREHATSWRAPSQPGEARLWAVLRDNRAGVTWTSQEVLVR